MAGAVACGSCELWFCMDGLMWRGEVEAAEGGAEPAPTVSGRKYRGAKMPKTETPKKLLKQENSFRHLPP